MSTTFLEGVDLSDLPPILCVPPPVLRIILSHLDGRDLARVSATSRPLRRLAVDETLWVLPFQLLLCDVFESSPAGQAQIKTLFDKDKFVRAVIKRDWANVNPRESFRRQYKEKSVFFLKQQRKERERQNLVSELKALRQRLLSQRKPLSDRFDVWKNCVAGDAVFRFYFYVLAIFLLLSLIMLHARLSYTPTLPWLAVCAPFSLAALVIGTLLLATAILYLPAFLYPDDRVVRWCFGYVLLARRSVEFSMKFMLYGCALVALCVHIVLWALHYDSLAVAGMSVDTISHHHLGKPVNTGLVISISASLPAYMSGIMCTQRFCPGSNDPLPRECIKSHGWQMLVGMSMLSVQCFSIVVDDFGGSNPIGLGACISCVLCVVGAAIIARGTVTAYRQAQRRITSLVLAAASGVLSAAFCAVFLLLLALKDYAILDVSYDVVFVPAWLAWAACFGMVVLLDVAGCLVWDTVFGYFGSFYTW